MHKIKNSISMKQVIKIQSRRIMPFLQVNKKVASVLLLVFFSMQKIQAQSCNCKEYIYLNEPTKQSVHKFQVGSNLLLNEITVGGKPWYPGNYPSSELPSPHGLGTDLNGFLYIGETGAGVSKVRKFTSDGQIFPTSQYDLTISEFKQNIFSIGNTMYYNGTDSPMAVDICTKTPIGKLCVNDAGGVPMKNVNLWGFSYNPKTEMVYLSSRYTDMTDLSNIFDRLPATQNQCSNIWAFTRTEMENAIANGTCINPMITMGASATVNPGEKFTPRTKGSLMGIVGDNNKNIYVVKSAIEGDASDYTRILKYNAQGQYLTSSPVDNTPPGPSANPTDSKYYYGIGLIWSETTNKLFMSNAWPNSETEDCISAFDANSMSYLGTAVPNPVGGGGGGKALAIIKECCPTPSNIVIDSTFCGSAINQKIYLQELLACEGVIGEGQWTPDPTNTGVTFDPCDLSIVINANNACAKFVLASNGIGNNPQCGAFNITLNIDVKAISNNTISSAQTVCVGNNAAHLTANATITTGGTLQYQWQKSTTDCNTGFTDIAGANSQTYNPGVVSQNTFYRAKISANGTCASGTCVETSNCVQITSKTCCPSPNCGTITINKN